MSFGIVSTVYSGYKVYKDYKNSKDARQQADAQAQQAEAAEGARREQALGYTQSMLDKIHGMHGQQSSHMQQYMQDWQATFGDVNTNMKNYFSASVGKGLEAAELSMFNQEMSKGLEQLRESFEQRGIPMSGLAGGAEADFQMQAAQGRAKIRAEAPAKRAQESMEFMKMGMQSDPRKAYSAMLSDQVSQYADIGKYNVGIQTKEADRLATRVDELDTLGEKYAVSEHEGREQAKDWVNENIYEPHVKPWIKDKFPEPKEPGKPQGRNEVNKFTPNKASADIFTKSADAPDAFIKNADAPGLFGRIGREVLGRNLT